jgi:C1A family cysteine protease
MNYPAALACLATLLAPLAARAQGAVLEDFEALRTQEPPSYRAVAPERFDLSPKMPPPRRQADTSSCVSWSVTYAAASLSLRERFPDLVLSPSFTYNQVARDKACQTATAASRTLEMLRTVGALPIDEFAFDAGFCGRMPTPAELARAANYKIAGWSSFDARDLSRVKQLIAGGSAVIFGMRSGPALRGLKSDAVLDTDESTGEGHEMVVVGYDDARKAFKVQNSWGTSWGAGGYGWLSWDFWRARVRTAYVIR